MGARVCGREDEREGEGMRSTGRGHSVGGARTSCGREGEGEGEGMRSKERGHAVETADGEGQGENEGIVSGGRGHAGEGGNEGMRSRG